MALAEAALSFEGVPFRLQGRDPAHGLDCIGLVLASLAQLGIRPALPADYRALRRDVLIPSATLRSAGLVETREPHRTGTIALMRTAPTQAHAAIAVPQGRIVHAHAGLRRVVVSPRPDHWPILAAWRLGPETVPEGDTAWQR